MSNHFSLRSIDTLVNGFVEFDTKDQDYPKTVARFTTICDWQEYLIWPNSKEGLGHEHHP